MKHPTDETRQRVMSTLMVLSRAYRGAVDKALASYGLSQATAWPVIMIARRGDGVRQGVLAEALGVEGPSLVRVLDHLGTAGLIERREDAHDRRSRTLHLTEAGRDLYGQIESVIVELRRDLLKDASAEDLEACLRVFDSLKTTLGREHAAPPQDG
ncbi:MAG TPA: MarR family transcriptional regulator [Bordetella sp.]